MTIIIEMLRKHEGIETHAYTDTVGKVTIGVGRNIDSKGGIGISDEEIDYLLTNDVRRVNAELVAGFSWYNAIAPARKDAMMDICFNLGLPRLKKFKKALSAMALGDYEAAATEFLDSRWAKQVGQRAITITNMIRSGSY